MPSDVCVHAHSRSQCGGLEASRGSMRRAHSARGGARAGGCHQVRDPGVLHVATEVLYIWWQSGWPRQRRRSRGSADETASQTSSRT